MSEDASEKTYQEALAVVPSMHLIREIEKRFDSCIVLGQRKIKDDLKPRFHFYSGSDIELIGMTQISLQHLLFRAAKADSAPDFF